MNDSTKTISFGNGVTTSLSSREFNLLKILKDNEGELVSRELSLTSVWGEISVWNARSMDVYICKLRKILKPYYKIINVHGKGHILQKS